ncbi:hypothetical protein CDAR_76431 [Caerostris darwini]|uniref:Uncharacterized protein n=1 Tax=Caerostris darwini TaxID=1538125 RepID=A0AAV4QFJ6_9ARAC|nr:hypothetical protein CDAR_76431 [Caerostris darwini]
MSRMVSEGIGCRMGNPPFPAWRSPRALVSFLLPREVTLPSTDRRRDRKEGVKLAVEVTWPQLGRSLESSPPPPPYTLLSLPPSLPRGINLPEFGLPPLPLFPPPQITSKLRDSTQRERERGRRKKKRRLHGGGVGVGGRIGLYATDRKLLIECESLNRAPLFLARNERVWERALVKKAETPRLITNRADRNGAPVIDVAPGNIDSMAPLASDGYVLRVDGKQLF